MEGFREELIEAEAGLNAVYDQVKDDASEEAGPAVQPERLPASRSVACSTWSGTSRRVEPPSYLMRIAPELYRQEQERVSRRFEEAVELAEQAFASEFARLVSHLAERLSGGDGERRVFRDSAVTNLTEFFQRFRDLNVRSSRELDELVEQAQNLVRGVTPQELRGDEGLRRQVAAEMGRLQTQLEGLVVERPRRQIIRPTPSQNGDSHAAGG